MESSAAAEPVRETPDIETSSEAYAGRFAGPVGTWFLELQARTTLDLLTPWPGASVLDVGGGHGQVTGALLEAGHRVTVLGSDPSCGQRVRPLVDAGRIRFASGDLLQAPYSEAAFDVVLAYRLLPHMVRWEALIAELCRLARHAVVVDYPTRRSMNAIAEAFFGVKKGIEGNTRPFTVFRDARVESAFATQGFRPTARRPQFLLPMALHRALGNASLAKGIETLALGVGATPRFGSPVILRLQR